MKLVEMGKASAGVSIDGAPPKNVFPPFQTLKIALPAFGFFSFKKSHAPILFIGGGSDNIFPPGLTKTIAGKYTDANSRVDVKIFEGKSHFICGEPGWEKVADYILDWHEGL